MIVAVIGASNNKEKYGNKVYLKLQNIHETYPVNPNEETIEGNKCYPNIKLLPKKPDMIVTVVKPEITEMIVEQCIKLKINKIWMQPGSESDKAIEMCKQNNIECTHNSCIML